MPITKSAKKALRSSETKKSHNDKRKKRVKEATKNITKTVLAKNKDEAKKLLSIAYKAIDKAAKKGTIKKNTASRKKSRLARMVKKI
ncbi:MAG: 30S ribosomal protein S20 [Candidatus Paceibacterota bacterium]|jgi:small subunit ribosomal protein S20